MAYLQIVNEEFLDKRVLVSVGSWGPSQVESETGQRADRD